MKTVYVGKSGKTWKFPEDLIGEKRILFAMMLVSACTPAGSFPDWESWAADWLAGDPAEDESSQRLADSHWWGDLDSRDRARTNALMFDAVGRLYGLRFTKKIETIGQARMMVSAEYRAELANGLAIASYLQRAAELAIQLP